MPGTPIRYPNGVTNAAKNSVFAQMGTLDPTQFHEWFDDFDNYAAADWIITTTELGASSATEAIAAGARGGILVLTNDSADNDADFLQWSGADSSTAVETFKITAGKKLAFEARFKVDNVTESDFVMGLQITDTTPLAVSDGIYFRKDDGDTDLDCVVIKGSSATTNTISGALANDTYVRLGFYYNGKSTAQGGGVEFYVNGVKRVTSVLTNLPDTEELTISFGIQNGDANARVMSIDYIRVIEER